MGGGGVGLCELGELGVVVGFGKCACEEVLHVDGVDERLAGCGFVAGGEEVAAAEFFWCEADGVRDLVHVAFEAEQGLRCAEAAEGAVRWDVGGHRLRLHAEVRPLVGAGRVDGGS